jgi:quinol monooxygenase YgiN
MSVIIYARFKLDTDKFERLLSERKADFLAVANEGKSKGAAHHQFAVGDGELVVIDEWTSAEAFQKFFEGQATISEMMEQVGLQGPPEVTVLRAVDSPDRF